MSAVRRCVHRGSVIAVGFVIDRALVGEAEARRRVIALWQPGATVLDAGDALVVSGLSPRRVEVDAAPGAPLIEQDGLLAAAPLAADERAALVAQAPPGTTVRVMGGVAEPVRTAGRTIDVADWIDLDALVVAEVAPLASPPAVVVVPVPVALDLRGAVGLGPPADDAVEMGAVLVRTDGGGPRESWWRRLTRRLAERADARRARAAGSGEAGGTTEELAGAGPTEPAAPGWIDRLRGRLSLALWRSWFGGILGRRHADHLRRTLALFDRGDLDQALRMAIPIGGRGGAASSLALDVPAPRDALVPSTKRPARRTAVPITPSAADLLRERYRAAFERLVREQRIAEAAFVLTDLLGEVAAAVDLLERHRRFELAARVAEAHDLDPELVARLWIAAGDFMRGVRVAHRRQAYAGVLAWLERRRDSRAQVLRGFWAERLAAAGAEAAAVDVAWPLTDRPPELPAWIERGLTLASPAASRLLVKKLVLAPGAFAQVMPAARAILADPSPEGRGRRRALAEELLVHPPTAPLRTLARGALRALWRDLGVDASDGLELRLADRLLLLAGDGALRADRPALAHGWNDRTRAIPSRTWRDTDVGQVAIHDAALLPDGRLLVALGELGVRLLARDGRVLAHFDQPASELVVADHGGRALAVARRDRFLRIARLDLQARRARPWTVAECDGGARSYDGDLWLTWRGSEVLAIDVAADDWRARWGVDTREPIRGIDRDGDHAAVVTATEVWHHQRLILRKRGELETIGRRGRVHRVRVRPAQEDVRAITSRPPAPLAVSDRHASLLLETGVPLALELDGNTSAAAWLRAGGVTVALVDGFAGARNGTLALDGAATVALRAAGGTLIVADDRGRLIEVDLRRGAVRADLRLPA